MLLLPAQQFFSECLQQHMLRYFANNFTFFYEKPFTVAACRRSEIDGKAILASWHEEYSCCYFEVREGETGCLYGYEGMYTLEALRKAEAAEKEGGA